MENCGEGILTQRHLSQIVSLHNLFLLCYEHCGIMITMTLMIMYVKWYLLFVTWSCLTLRPHGLQHIRPPWPSPSPGVCSSSCPLLRWYHPAISSSVVPFSFCLQSFSASGLFKWDSSSHQVATLLEFQLQHLSFHEHAGPISFRMDWLALLAVQGTLKSLLQHHSTKASILQWTTFFIVQLSHPYMTTGKTTALIRQTFIVKVMSLLFNMLFRLVNWLYYLLTKTIMDKTKADFQLPFSAR